jgi:hypothetical protein
MNDLLESIAKTIADYRTDELDPPTPEHVDTWIGQFDKSVRESMLTEIDHILKRTYFPRKTVKDYLSNLSKNGKLAGNNPPSFWKDVKFLDIQGGGNSQSEMLGMFDEILQSEFGLAIDLCGKKPKAFLYLDDATFSGNRVRIDLGNWIKETAAHDIKVHIVSIALHTAGQRFANGRIASSAREIGKKVDVTWWRFVPIEDYSINSSDVLRPRSIPNDQPTLAYAQSLKFPPILRTRDSLGSQGFFSSEDGRNLLEQELLKAGVKIRSMCPYLNNYQRPLGNSVLETLGFGSLFVTFRNCPNNCPLAFWAGNPWYPLFPRKTN